MRRRLEKDSRVMVSGIQVRMADQVVCKDLEIVMYESEQATPRHEHQNSLQSLDRGNEADTAASRRLGKRSERRVCAECGGE